MGKESGEAPSKKQPLKKRAVFLLMMLIGLSIFLIFTPLGPIALELLRYVYPPLENSIIALLSQLTLQIVGFFIALGLIYIGYKGLKS